MNNLYHPDIYKFDTPIKSYWEDTSNTNFNLEKLNKDTSAEIVVIGGGYTGLSCAINLIENYNLDVILVDAGKIGWGASSRNGGFCSFPPSKMPYKKMQKIYGREETRRFFKNSIEGSNYTRNIIKDYKIDCDVTGDKNFIVAHHPSKFDQIKEQSEIYEKEFGIETKIYSKEEFSEIGHGGIGQFGAISYKQVFATNGFYQEGLIPQLNSRILPVFSNIIVTRKLTNEELDVHNLKTYDPIVNCRNLLHYYRKLPDNRILFGTRGDLVGSEKSNEEISKKIETFLKSIFPGWSNINIEYKWRGLIALSQKLTPSIGKIQDEEIYYGFGYSGVGVSSAPWTGKQLSKLVFSSNSKDLEISKIYKGLPKKFIFPKLRIFYFRMAVWFYMIKDKLNI